MRRSLLLLCLFAAAMPAAANVITSADLQISGANFKLVTASATVQMGSAAVIQTSLGDLQNDQAPVFTDGTVALAELIGPGITTPVPFVTAPGRAFTVSGLSQEGTYYLQNVRMMIGDKLLQVAQPSLAVIQVTNALNASITVKQLSADDLRKRGITLDPNNYDVFEYTVSFLVNGQIVSIPYPVVINRNTHEATPLPTESPYQLPSDTRTAPPRWNPPATVPFEFPEGGFSKPVETPDAADAGPPPRPQIHAAIVIPNSLAVLHEFFGVALVVTNGAPSGSGVTLDSITASLDAPSQLRLAKVDPPVTFGKPVTIAGPNGVTVLAAQVQGKAEWTYEGLKAGTYTVNLDVKATFHSPGQPDQPLEATPSASIVVHDARFNIAFSHPETIRKGLQYSTHTFITNVSEAAQDITLSDSGVPTCSSGASRANVCRVDNTPSSYSVHLDPGETKGIEYKLISSLTGHVFATAVSIDGSDSAINSAAFTLDMGVSPTGVPLSPVTLILPHYATAPYLSQPFLDDQLGFLGIAYSLATAPLNKATAKFPRLVQSDVFTRAVDIARAGERIFLGEDSRDSLASLTLDLFGNDVALSEWDAFRRQEIADPAGDTARAAMTALATELTGAYGTAGTFGGLADRFAGATSDRAPYLLAIARGPKNGTAPAFAVRVTSGSLVMDGVGSAASGWKRDIPYGEVDALEATSESATLAVIGRASGAYDLTITPAVSGSSSVDLIVPSADSKTLVRASVSFSATAGQAIHVHAANGVVTSSDAGISFTATPVAVAPLRIVGARQDLFLDADGHVVSVLYNRRLPANTNDLSADFDTDISLDPKFGITYSGKRPVAGAALQGDGRIIRLNYDSALTNDAQYAIHVKDIPEAGTTATVVPKIEDRNGALLFGTVLKGDNTVVPNATLVLKTGSGLQYQTADASGQFLFEYVPRDPDNGLSGGYILTGRSTTQETTIKASVRLLHTVHRVNLVFLGRGSAKGVVRYENGAVVANATVVVGSTMFNLFRTATTDLNGAYSVSDVPVGPLTFSAKDAAGNVSFAANELHAGGEVVIQDVTIIRKPFPGLGSVRGRIVRSDTGAAVPNTHVGVYSQGYGLQDTMTDSLGAYQFTKVPSGFVTVLAENYAVAPKSIAIDFDLKADEVRNLADLVLGVPAAGSLVAVSGTVTIEDPYIAGRFTPVPMAQVQLAGMPVVIADNSGAYHYDAVPTTFGGSGISGFDPKSGRVGSATLPQSLLTDVTNNVPITITNASGSGNGTIRVHLLDARGLPVVGYHVFEPGFPRLESTPGSQEGTYEFRDLRVGRSLDVVAAPSATRDATYGYQWTEGHAAVQFPGQIAALTLRLPGQTDVHAIIKQATEAGVIVQLAGQLHLWHRYWSDIEQSPKSITRLATTDGTHDAIFDQVPAGESILLETFESVGYASTSFTIGFDRQPVTQTLTLSTLASVSGRVFMPDGYTPVAGAQVNLVDGAQDMGWLPTALDGSYQFKNVSPSSGFTVKAEFTQNGIFRTGYTSGSTPQHGGPVSGISIILLKQGSVEGTVSDANGQPIPFAKIWLTELSFPRRSFGTQHEPLTTDQSGHFRFNNIFAVPFRVDAEDPNNPDLRGSFNGVVASEAQVVQSPVTVGGAGVGTVQITVKDSNTLQVVPNAEVSLFRSSLFDLATTDLNGIATFLQVPVGSYTAGAYSKSLAKSGGAGTFLVTKGGTASVNINLEFSGEIQGTLDDPQNALPGIPAANVTLFGDGYTTRATTDTTGAFDIKGVREGTVQLVAQDPSSIRQAKNAAAISSANRLDIVAMHLESTSNLTVKVFLPNDSGASSGVLAPNVELDLVQNAPGGSYHRTSQTNGDTFPGLVRGRIPFRLTGQEIGGLGRSFIINDSFDDATPAKEIDYILAASGTVLVHVQQGSPAADAPNVQVTASSGGTSTSAFTDSTGRATLTRLPLGTVSIQATTAGAQPLTGATSVSLTSQTQSASATILLGSYGGVTGKVIAEAGGASAGTRVFASFNGIHLETRTDATGAYTFQGIATPLGGTSITLTYVGPDDNTVGAVQTVLLQNGEGIKSVNDVRLDSTPPRLIGIFPADSAASVAPDTQLKFTFSREIRDDQLNSNYFKLFDVGAAQSLTLSFVSKELRSDKSEVLTFSTPPTPAGQRFPLKSNTLYRSEVSATLQDTANHELGAILGASFTTSDYSNPQVVKVDPKSPLPKNNFRLAVTFSKPLNPAAWATGGSGVMQLTPISAIGGTETGAALAGQVQLDPSTGATLYFAPDVLINESSFYRLSITGVADLDGRGLVDGSGNALAKFTQDFFSYDTTAPGVTISNPIVNGSAIGDADPLYTGTLYRFPVALTNASDLKQVDFYTVDAAGTDVPLNRSTATSADVSLPQGTTSFTLKAIVTDLSGNKASVTRTWTVSSQPPLSVVSATVTPATIYPGNTLTDTVVVSGGGLDETVTVTAKLGSTILATAQSTITRSTFASNWPNAVVALTIPVTTAGGSPLVLTEVVSDVRGGSATHTTNVTLATDTVAPSIQTPTIEVVSGTSNTTFQNNNTFRVHALSRDDETGINKVTFTVDGATLNAASTRAAANGYTEYISPTFTVHTRNNDLAMPVTATALDNAGLTSSSTTSVTYLGQHDPNAPTVAWISPLHDAAWPANTAFTTKLRLYAASSLPLNVTFDVPTMTAGQAGVRSGNEYDLNLSFAATPAAGTPFTIIAHVNDGDGGHTADLPITIDLVAVTQTLHAGDTYSVDAQQTLTGDSILVDGGRLVPHVPITVKNLIVVNGGLVDTVPTTKSIEQKLNITVSGHLYVDDRSSIDVSRRGYLGGLQQNFDGTDTNSDLHGMTVGRTTVGGAGLQTSASYAGIGGADNGGTNATYGSITAPADLGSGGGADTGNHRGGQGGGALNVSGAAKIVVAGNVLADGESGQNIGGAGSGGSIHIAASQLVIGPFASISASGGDDDGSASFARGAGAGRIALEATSLLDIDTNNGTRVAAHGGRNLTSEGAAVLEGGAGTIFLRNPQSTDGDLTVSGYDPRFTTTTHSALSTVLDGTLRFDHLAVGPRGLARAEAALTIGGVTNDRTKASIDPAGALVLAGELPAITFTTNPASGATIVGGTKIDLSYSATSNAGVASVTSTLSPVLPAIVDSYAFVATAATSSPKALNIPSSTPSGTATLTVHVVDRAGRSFDATPSTFNIVANSLPAITTFNVTAPSPLYIGGRIDTSITATDDLALTSVSLTSQLGTQPPASQTFTPPANTTSTTQAFSVTVPVTTSLDGTTATLTATAQDAAGAPGTRLVKTVQIAHDGIPPVVTILKPDATTGAYDEGSAQLIHVIATAVDAETGIRSITASVEGGETLTMAATANANEFAIDLHIPSVPGSVPLTRNVTVTVTDIVGNISAPTRAITINPSIDPSAPVITFVCGSNGAMVPVGQTITLSVNATPGSNNNPVDTVTFSDGSSNTFPVTKNGTVYSISYTVPQRADGDTIRISVTGTSGTGSQTEEAVLTAAVIDKTIPAGTTVNNGDLTYDFQNVLVSSGTVTLIGHHEFKRLLVINGATITQKTADATSTYGVDVKTTLGTYVGCTSFISVNAGGYGVNQSYPGAPPLNGSSGGSHLGYGGNNSAANSTYGSVYRPKEAGSGGNRNAGGGGIVRLDANTLTNDGVIRADGCGGGGVGDGCAGGSVWITAPNLNGVGTIEANGGGGLSGSGAGGAVAVEYTSATGTILNKLFATGGSTSLPGGAGTVYLLHSPAQYGTLLVNNAGANAPTELPSLGSGAAASGSSGAVLVTDRTSNIPAYFAWHWVQITSAATGAKNFWRILSIDPVNAKKVTLQPNGAETINIQPGDAWQGVYRFDGATVSGNANLISKDPILIGAAAAQSVFGSTVANTYSSYPTGIVGDNITITGHVSTPSIKANSLTLESGVILTSPTGSTLLLDVTGGNVNIKSGASIDVSFRGYGVNQTYTGAAALNGSSGGNHLGYGGNNSAANSTYGSVYQPNELGSGGNRNSGGGGAVKIVAASVNDDGSILANGCGGGGTGDGCAGGSVWIKAPSLGGAGIIEVKGGNGLSGSGAGGAIALDYTTATGTLLSNLRAYGGNTSLNGGAGTIYQKTPGGAYGTLTVDNAGAAANAITELPSLGSGLAAAGSSGATLITDRTSDIPAYFANHWVQVTSAATGAKNTWRILSIDPVNAKKVTLQPNGSETIGIQPGDAWRGVYRFDAVNILNNANFVSHDAVLIGASGVQTVFGSTVSGSYSLYTVPIVGDDIDILGHVSATKIQATSLTLEPNAILTSPTGSTLTLTVPNGAVNIKAGASIDMSFRGYGVNQTYSGAASLNGSSGGNHLGFGGNNSAANSTYGSVYHPFELGSGGNRNAGGGGAVQINAGSVNNDGSILANGCGGGGTGDGCAGGSVWITAPQLSGSGIIEARGGNGLSGSGAGGAIGLDYTAATGTLLSNVRAYGGNTSLIGGAGTVFQKSGGTYGSLIISNNGIGGTTELPSLGYGVALTGSSGAVLVTDRTSDVPAYFVFHWIEVRNANGNVKGTWRILSIDPVNAKKVTLAPNATEAIDIQPGDQWRGIYRFDGVTISGAITLRTGDRLDAPVTGGTVVGNNQGAPALDKTKITIVAQLVGPVMVGAPGAVTDPETPITAFALNQNTGASTAAATVASDGSFSIPLRGTVGDPIAVYAKDASVYPMQTVPVFIGNLPSANTTPQTFPITSAQTANDGSFRARRLSLDNNTLLVANYPASTDTNKMLVYDVSTGSPVWTQTLQPGVVTRDVVVNNNVAYVAGGCANVCGTMYAFDLSVNPAPRQSAAVGCNGAYSMTVDGGYGYIGGDCGDGHIAIYDLSNPKVPIFLRDQGFSGLSSLVYTQIIPFGNYLIALTGNLSSTAPDVLLIDRHDPNSFSLVWKQVIPNFTAFRGSLQGTTLYMSGSDGSFGVMDLSNPLSPVLKSVTKFAGASFGMTADGTTAFLAADVSGVVAFDATNPASPVAAGGIATSPSSAWDVVFRGRTGYVAAEDRLLTFTAAIPPQVNASKLSVTFDGTSVATVRGAAGAVTGLAPLTVQLHDDTSNTAVPGVSVSTDGSFSGTITSAAGHVISVIATDASNLASSSVVAGSVPFATGSSFVQITPSISGDANFRVRHLSVDGNTLAAIHYPVYGGTEPNKLLLYDISNVTPALSQVLSVRNNPHDVVVTNNVAYVAGGCGNVCNNVFAYDLSTTPATPRSALMNCNGAWSIAADGGYLYVGGDCGSGNISIFDITDPKQPVFLRGQDTALFGCAYTQIIPWGNSLIAITPNGGANATDVMIIDRRDPTNLVRKSATAILNLVAFRGKVVGTNLYLSGEGTNNTMAIVDLTNVSAPTYKVYATPGGSRGVAVAGNVAAFGDGTAGVTFFDVTNPASAQLLGTQPVGGMTWDVALGSGVLYTASEVGIGVITGIVAPPVVDATRLSIAHTTMSAATVTGSAFAVTGAATPLTVQVTNQTTGATVTGIAVAANGSFTASIAAVSGNVIIVVATDAKGRTSAPASAGTVPFGTSNSFVQITPTISGDSNFRARRLSIDGNTLAATNYPITDTSAGRSWDSNRIVLYDVSSGAPVLSQVLQSKIDPHDVVVKNNVVYAAGACDNVCGAVYAYDLSTTPVTTRSAAMNCNGSWTLAVDGNYMYVGGDCGSGRVSIYDLTDPKQPIYLRTQDTAPSSGNYTQLIPWGKYLIGITPDGGANGTDVIVIDRSDPNSMVRKSATAILNLVGFRGRIVGNNLYLSGQGTNSAMAVVDLTNVSAPTYTVYPTPGGSRGVAVAGNVAAFGDGISGVTFFDVTNPASAQMLGSQPVGGMTWDVAISGGRIYAAAEQGVAVINGLVTPPVVDATRLSVAHTSPSSATVSGAPFAVTGAATPMTVQVTNQSTGAIVSGIAVDASGSFSASIPAVSGNVISVIATDASNLKSSSVVAGQVPFGTSNSFVQITPTISGDSNFRARRLSIDGNTLAVTNYPITDAFLNRSWDSNRIVLYDVSSGTPVLSQVLQSRIDPHDVVVKNNVVYAAGACDNVCGAVYAYDLSTTPVTTRSAAIDCNGSWTLAVDGNYMYVGGDCGSGRVSIYDLTDPKQPIFLRAQDTAPSSGNYTQLIPWGKYLIGITPDGGANGTDVIVIDRSDPNNMVRKSATAILNLVGFRGKIVGNNLYLSGQGTNSAMAIVDLTNVSAPTYTVYPTPGGSRGVAVAGNVAAFGDGMSGVTFFDVTNPASAQQLGSQPTGGMTWDVAISGGRIYAAAEDGVAVVNGAVAPPFVDTTRITVSRTTSTTAAVTGRAGAVTGAATPLTLRINDTATAAATTGVPVAADGSFTATITASAGDPLTLTATDGNGANSATTSLGLVPFGTASSFVQITPSMAGGDANFRARHLSVDGNTLAAIHYPIYGGTEPNKLLLFDVSSGTPVLSQTISASILPHDVTVKNNVAYTVGGCGAVCGTVYAYDLSTTPATPRSAAVGCNSSWSITADSGYLYVGGDCGFGNISIFDITDPKQPLFLRRQDTASFVCAYTQIIPWGNYLIGVTPNGGSAATDVMVIDRRDINAMQTVARLAVNGLLAFRGTVSGSTLYLSGEGTNSAMAVVNLSNPTAPTYNVFATPGGSRGVATAGNTAVFGDGTSGVTFFDVTNPASPRLVGSQPDGGMTWDVAIASGRIYAAAEQGIATISGAALAPVFDPSRISVTRASATTAAIAGTAFSVTGNGQLTVTVKNETTSAVTTGFTVAAGGSFTATVAASAGDSLTITAADLTGATSTAVNLGAVPFGSVVRTYSQSAVGDANFRLRHISVDGNWLGAVNYPMYAVESTHLLLYDVTSGTPVLSQNLVVPVFPHAVVVKNNVAYTSGGCSAVCGTVFAYDLTTTPPVRQQASVGCNGVWSLLVDGNYMYAGGDCGDGHISIYDISNPKAPVLLRDQGTGLSGISFTQLMPYGNYLIGTSDDGGANGLDVAIIDRSNISSLTRISSLSIPNFLGFRGEIVGHMLYVSGRDTHAGMAVVDLTNVASPTYTVYGGLNGSRGVGTSGSYAIFGDGTSGITFFDITNPSAARFLATQKFGGMSWDVKAAGSKLYVASEQFVGVVDLSAFGGSASLPAPVPVTTAAAPTSPPPLLPADAVTLHANRTLISTSGGDGRVIVRGARGALTGPQPVSIEIRNATLGTTLPVVPVAADGSFTAEINASPEDHLILAVISGDGERLEIDLGSHE